MPNHDLAFQAFMSAPTSYGHALASEGRDVPSAIIGQESPVTPQHSPPSGATPYLSRTCTGWDRTSFAWRTHSMTLSARSTSVAGSSIPIALAVRRLITSSNLVGCSTGRSAGLAPRNTLTSMRAIWRQTSTRDGPYAMRPPSQPAPGIDRCSAA